MQRVDLSHDGVPFESPSNKEIMATSQYFGEDSTSRGFDQETANKLNEKWNHNGPASGVAAGYCGALILLRTSTTAAWTPARSST